MIKLLHEFLCLEESMGKIWPITSTGSLVRPWYHGSTDRRYIHYTPSIDKKHNYLELMWF